MDQRLGTCRRSMKTNPLLQKAEIGRSVRRCYKLPDKQVVYGRPSDHDDTGVAEAMNHLSLAMATTSARTSPCPSLPCLSPLPPTARERSRRLPAVDYVALNKAAVLSPRPPTPPRSKYCPSRTRVVPADMTHGVQGRRSPPINELLTENYLLDWIQNQQTKLRATEKKRNEIKYGAFRRYGYADTRTTALRQLNLYAEAKNMADTDNWQLPKFKKIGSKVDSKRK